MVCFACVLNKSRSQNHVYSMSKTAGYGNGQAAACSERHSLGKSLRVALTVALSR